MLVCEEGRRRWVRGCIKITESMHAYGFQVLPSPLFFWSAACRYSCSQKGYPVTIITWPYRGLRYFTPWNTRRRTPYILQKEFFSAEKRSAQLAFLQIPRRAFLCVFVCVVYRTWKKHTRFERSLLLKIFYLSGFAVFSITGWDTTFIGFLSNINQFPRSVASYFPLASFRDILTSTGYTLQGDWPQKP